MSSIKFTARGHRWEWDELSGERGSLRCLNPIIDEHGVDQSTWPSDEEIAVHVGRGVRFLDAGDSPAHPEGIFALT